MTFYYSAFESNNNRTTYGSFQKDPKTIYVTYLENICPSCFVLGSQIDGQMNPSLRSRNDSVLLKNQPWKVSDRIGIGRKWMYINENELFCTWVCGSLWNWSMENLPGLCWHLTSSSITLWRHMTVLEVPAHRIHNHFHLILYARSHSFPMRMARGYRCIEGFSFVQKMIYHFPVL